MTKFQRTILLVMAIMISAMFLYPPFTYTSDRGTIISLGYSWIFEPPVVGLSAMGSFINIPMLLIQWAAVIIVGGIVFLAASPRK